MYVITLEKEEVIARVWKKERTYIFIVSNEKLIEREEDKTLVNAFVVNDNTVKVCARVLMKVVILEERETKDNEEIMFLFTNFCSKETIESV